MVMQEIEAIKSDRKLRLFALACMRNIQSHLNSYCVSAIDKLELFIEGKISKKELAILRESIGQLWDCNEKPQELIYCLFSALDEDARIAAIWGSHYCKDFMDQMALIKEIHNPNLLDIRFSDLAVSLAEQVYEGDEKARCVLSDYLEEERYPAEIVTHLKSGFHPKGCWLIDQVLGK